MPIKTIQELNDSFRQSGKGGGVVITCRIDKLPAEDKQEILGKVRYFSDFNEDNDPNGEHDFGCFEHNSNKIFWKIDYYSNEIMERGSEDPGDPNQTFRLLTIMLADEY